MRLTKSVSAQNALLFGMQNSRPNGMVVSVNSKSRRDERCELYAYMLTLSDNPGVSPIQNESPGLPYG